MLYRLKNAGYDAFLVGGCVRDMLLGREPKDFDVATNALPEEIEQLFRNCRLIGRRFRLAHIMFGKDIVEVATFRATTPQTGDDEARQLEDGLILRDNVYGTIEEDAWRRDFRVNALYYNISDFSVVDYTGGLEDLRNGVLSLIGDARVRLREDPVRMLRAVRFAVKLGFRIDDDCERAMVELAPDIQKVPAARLFDEVSKLFLSGFALQTFETLRHYGLFAQLFPATDSLLESGDRDHMHRLLVRGLENSDKRVAEDKPVTPAFLLAVLMWEPVLDQALRLEQERGMKPMDALYAAMGDILQQQAERIALPRRFSIQIREIWSMQSRLERRGKRALKLVQHPRFRAAYDFLLLRGEANPELAEMCDWWTAFQERNDNGRENMLKKVQRKRSRRRRRRGGQGQGGDEHGGDDGGAD